MLGSTADSPRLPADSVFGFNYRLGSEMNGHGLEKSARRASFEKSP